MYPGPISKEVMALSDIASCGDMMPLAACDILFRDEAGLQQLEEQGDKSPIFHLGIQLCVKRVHTWIFSSCAEYT